MTLRHEMAVPLDFKCACSKARRIPVSLDAEFWALMLLLLKNVDVSPATRVLVVFCRHCSTEGEVTVGDLRLDNGRALSHMLSNRAPRVSDA